jgi:hypothetical protein
VGAGTLDELIVAMLLDFQCNSIGEVLKVKTFFASRLFCSGIDIPILIQIRMKHN